MLGIGNITVLYLNTGEERLCLSTKTTFYASGGNTGEYSNHDCYSGTDGMSFFPQAVSVLGSSYSSYRAEKISQGLLVY